MHRHLRATLPPLMTIAALVLPACAGPRAEPASGSAEIVGTTSGALSAADVQRVALTITGPGIDAPIFHELAHVGTKWQGTVGAIPAGSDRTFHADAFDSTGAVIYSGAAANVTVTHGTAVVVALLLQQQTPPAPFQNTAPKLDAFVASSNAVVPGQTVSLGVTAHDPNAGDTLTYEWSGGGSFSSTSTPTTTWTAPATEGPQSVTIRVRDQKGAMAAMTLSIDVSAANGRGSAAVDTAFNTWPEVTSVNADPTHIDVGQSTQLALAASDADADPLAYAWTSSCDGHFSDVAAQNPTFTLDTLGGSDSCALSVHVTDGRGGSNTGEIVIHLGPETPANLAPVVDTTFQSASTASAGQSVDLRVTAHDPEGTALGFSWTSSAGTLGPPSTAGTSSEIVWTAPAGFTGVATLTVTITDATGVSTTQTWEVASVAPCNPGGCIVTIASGQSAPYAIAVDATRAYWTNFVGETIVAAPLAGGAPTTLASGQTQPYALAIDGTHAYWASYDGGTIMRVPLGGGAPSPIASAQAGPYALAIDATSVYWANYDDGTIVKAPLAGGATTPVASGQSPVSIAVDATSVYWANETDGTIMKVPLTGGAPAPLTTGPAFPYALAIDGTRVYWTLYDDGLVLSVPLAGGASSPVASGQSSPSAIAVDGTSVYWTNAAAIMKAPAGGGGATTLVPGQGAPSGIAVRGTRVYWTNYNSGTVMSATK